MSNKNGRPPIYEDSEKMAKLDNGRVVYKGEKIANDSFQSERELVDYVVDNIGKFAKDYLGDDVKSFEVECPINERIKMSPRGRRVDLFIEGDNKDYVIEFKTPTSGSEIRYALGQLLDYGREFFDSNKKEKVELLLISDLYDSSTAKTIEYFDLPIRYIYFDKTLSLEFYETA